MALKHKVEDITTVDEKFRSEYIEMKEGDKSVFVLQVEGIDDAKELRRALENEREERRKLAEKAVKLGQDVESVTKDADRRIAALNEQIRTHTEAKEKAETSKALSEAVNGLAVKLSATSPSLFVPVIEKRLRVMLEDGKPNVRVLDTDGRLTAMSVSDLEAEFRSNKEYAPVITGSRASGSGAGGEHHGAGGAGSTGDGNTSDNVDLNKLSAKQLADRAKAARQARGLER